MAWSSVVDKFIEFYDRKPGPALLLLVIVLLILGTVVYLRIEKNRQPVPCSQTINSKGNGNTNINGDCK